MTIEEKKDGVNKKAQNSETFLPDSAGDNDKEMAEKLIIEFMHACRDVIIEFFHSRYHYS